MKISELVQILEINRRLNGDMEVVLPQREFEGRGWNAKITYVEPTIDQKDNCVKVAIY